MLIPPLTKRERDDLLLRKAKASERYREALAADDLPAARRADSEGDAAEAEYLERLPVVAMSVCPFTAQPLLRSFDPFGLDGPWWQEGASRPGPIPPRTFCVMRGAVHFQGKKPIGPVIDVALGPEVPYVIPKLLEVGNMTAVIGELAMAPGYRAFTIAYFAKPKPHPKHLTSDWLEGSYSYKDLFGENGTVIPVDLWDFDLAPWMERGKVRWCVPGSGNEKLAVAGKPGDCPYLDLKGRREYLCIRGDMVWDRGLPDGEPISPSDLLD